MKGLCPYTGIPVEQCECHFTDKTSPFYAYREAVENNDAKAKHDAEVAIEQLKKNPKVRREDE